MTKRLTIGFLLATLLLVGFEYLFLHELYSSKRTALIITGIVGIVIASALFILFFIKYRKASDES
jgi:hypothetical protein